MTIPIWLGGPAEATPADFCPTLQDDITSVQCREACVVRMEEGDD